MTLFSSDPLSFSHHSALPIYLKLVLLLSTIPCLGSSAATPGAVILVAQRQPDPCHLVAGTCPAMVLQAQYTLCGCCLLAAGGADTNDSPGELSVTVGWRAVKGILVPVEIRLKPGSHERDGRHFPNSPGDQGLLM